MGGEVSPAVSGSNELLVCTSSNQNDNHDNEEIMDVEVLIRHVRVMLEDGEFRVRMRQNEKIADLKKKISVILDMKPNSFLLARSKSRLDDNELMDSFLCFGEDIIEIDMVPAKEKIENENRFDSSEGEDVVDEDSETHKEEEEESRVIPTERISTEYDSNEIMEERGKLHEEDGDGGFEKKQEKGSQEEGVMFGGAEREVGSMITEEAYEEEGGGKEPEEEQDEEVMFWEREDSSEMISDEESEGVMFVGPSIVKSGESKEEEEEEEEDNNNNITKFEEIFQTHFRNGKKFQEERNPDMAINEFSQALTLFPKNIDALTSRSFCYLETKQYDLAIEDLRHILRVEEDDSYTLLNLGNVYMAMNKPEEAVTTYRKCISSKPERIEERLAALTHCGLMLIQMGKFGESFEMLNDAVKLQKKKKEVHSHSLYLNRSTVLIHMKKFGCAVRDLSIVLELDPGNYLAKIRLERLRNQKTTYDMSSGEFDCYEVFYHPKDTDEELKIDGLDDLTPSEAVKELTRRIEGKSCNKKDTLIILYHRRGMIYLSIEEFKMAVEDFDLCETLDGKYFDSIYLQKCGLIPSIFVHRGSCYQALGEDEKAYDDWNKAIVMDKNLKRMTKDELVTSFLGRARYYFTSKKYDYALLDARVAVSIYPTHPKAQDVLREYEDHMGLRNPEISDEVREKIKVMHDMALALRMDGMISESEDLHLSTRYLEGVRDNLIKFRSPHSAFCDLGDIYVIQKRAEKAIEVYTIGLVRDPENVETLMKRGEVYSDSGFLEDAVRDFSRVLELDEGNVEARVCRGSLYLGLRWFIEAERDLVKVLESQPSHEEARKLWEVAKVNHMKQRKKERIERRRQKQRSGWGSVINEEEEEW